MVLFINETGTIGVIYNAVVTNITGSEFLTLLGVLLIMLLFLMAFHIPIEAGAILILPMLLIFMAFNNNILAIAGIALIYLGIILAKNFFIN
jgi:hypothetical protein